MLCFGRYKPKDRICDLCEETNPVAQKCKVKTEEEQENRNKIWDIKCKCPHMKELFCEWQRYSACTLKRDGRNYEICIPSLECEKYCK